MSSARYELPSIFDITCVSETKPRLLEALAEDADLVLDGRHTERTDAAGLQLLVALCVEAERRGFEVSWDGCSTALFEAAAFLGLQPLLHLDPGASR